MKRLFLFAFLSLFTTIFPTVAKTGLPSVNIDWNGGTVTGFLGVSESLSGLWSYSEWAGVTDDMLTEIIGMDIGQEMGIPLAQELIAGLMDSESSVTVHNPGKKFVGFNTKSDGTGPISCIYPECNTLYAVWWDENEPMPSINIDWNGGTVTGFLGISESLSGLWSYSEWAGVTEGDLYEASGMDMGRELGIPLAQELIAGLMDSESSVTVHNPGKTFVGFNTKSDGTGLTSCMYPTCNTLYAVWWDEDEPLPGVSIDMNGGYANMNYAFPEYPIFPENSPNAVEIMGVDIASELIYGYGTAMMESAQNPEPWVSVSRPGYKLVGFSADPNKLGVNTCVYPACHKVYAIWEADPTPTENHRIIIDFNGGELSATMEGLSLLAQSAIFFPDNAPQLAELHGVDLWSANGGFAEVQEEVLLPAANGEMGPETTFQKEGYIFAGLSMDKNTPGLTECVYPACNTMYAVWISADDIGPGIKIDMNGGKLRTDGTNYTEYTFIPDGAPKLATMAGKDIWTEFDVGTIMTEWLELSQNPTESNALINGNKMFVGFSTTADGTGGQTCVYPECDTLYAIWWDKDKPLPPVVLDFNGGHFMVNLVASYKMITEPYDWQLWNQYIGTDIWDQKLIVDKHENSTTYQQSFEELSEEFITQEGYFTVNIARPGYRIVGLSTDKNKLGATRCIYPVCNTYYAVWEPIVVTSPAISVDPMGGHWHVPEDWSALYEDIPFIVLPDNASQLAEIHGQDLYSVKFIDVSVPEYFEFVFSYYSQNPDGADMYFEKPKYRYVGLSTNPYKMVENPTCIYPDCHVFYAIWELDAEMCPVMDGINLGGYDTVRLYKNKVSSPSIVVKKDGQMCYANMVSGRRSGTINMRYNGEIYHAE